MDFEEKIKPLIEKLLPISLVVSMCALLVKPHISFSIVPVVIIPMGSLAILSFQYATYFQNKILWFLNNLGASIGSVAILFKIMNWPVGQIFSIAGLGLLSITTLFIFTDKSPIESSLKPEFFYSRALFLLVVLASGVFLPKDVYYKYFIKNKDECAAIYKEFTDPRNKDQSKILLEKLIDCAK
ncbi:MAG: hypothetical protein U0V72_11780 [Cytophagales bacterium]